MRLAIVCTEMLPSPAIRGGAIQIMIDGIVPYLSGWHHLTVYSVADEELPNYENKKNIRYIRFAKEKYTEEVARSLASNKYDVVHVCNRPRNVILFKKAAPSSRFVLSLHNEMFAASKLTDEEAKQAVQAVHKITTVSDYIKKTVTDRVPEAESKTVTVYSGFNINTYHPVWSDKGKEIRSKMRAKYGLQNKKVILFVGRLSVKKGPHLLIQAMNRILLRHPNAVLVIVGGRWFSDDRIDEYGKRLLSLAAPFGKKVIFTKFVQANEIQNYFLMGDVFVCSSQWQEPLARVHYEAMASGTPIVTTNRGGNSEVVKHKYNGYLVRNYTSPASFAAAINFMLSNRRTARLMASRGRLKVEKGFTFEHVADRFNSVYMSAYNSSPTLLKLATISPRRRRAVRKTPPNAKQNQEKGR